MKRVAIVLAALLLFLFAGALPLWLLGAVFCRVREKKRKY